ncbi:MAG: peptidase U32 family protein [Candidatus Saelkia tenebricola]|nr:peptidase U32 family protein [Candidatus Saelkia tenebricola]
MKIIKPELISPAGDWTSLVTAVQSGADSVYFGVKGFNMRERADNFDVSEIKRVMSFLHKNSKKGYLALNIIIKNEELNKVKRILQSAKSSGVDAVILWDMAVLAVARDLKLRVHLSTQASVSNFKALSFYAKLGVKRIVLARECTLTDIRKIINSIKKECLKCEIETFIHGAMCISVSGRCFLSYYSSGASANRGRCLQPCRREFEIKDVNGDTEYVMGEDYILSPKDLCSIEFIDSLIEAGINAFKIEGRMRSPEYVKVVTSTYRKAIDAFYEGELSDSLKKKLKRDLKIVYNRGFSDGFYFGRPDKDISRRLEHIYEKVFLGEVLKFYKKLEVAEIIVKAGHLRKGDMLLFVGKNTPVQFVKADQMQQEHEFVSYVKKGALVGVKVPFIFRAKDKVYIWRKKR